MTPVITLVALLVISVPVAVAILLAAALFVADSSFPFSLVAQRVFSGLNSFTILAIPLFVLAGELMNASKITDRIVQFANALVGHLRAGLAQVNIWSSVIFAGLSGSAVADTSALGRVFIPSMAREGYPKAFAAALTASSSIIGPIIPPSIPVIIYALVVGNVSVPGMFLAGIVPGLLLALALSIYVRLFCANYADRRPRASWRERLTSLRLAIVPLAMPIFVVGSIAGGVVTPTEAAAFAVIYALLAGLFVLRTLKLSDLPPIFIKAMSDASVILLVIAAVALGNWLLTFARVPQALSELVTQNINDPLVFLLMVNVLLILIGLFLEGIAAMLVLVPILHPIAVSLGIDPTHFAIVVIFNLMIGMITPPMGLCLFVSDSIARVGIGALTRQVMPMFLAALVALLLITLFPPLTTWLPRLAGF